MTVTENRENKLRRMTADDLKVVLAWRNHLDVRRYMYTQHEITLAEHSHWFERASQDTSRHLLMFESASTPLGFINIHEKNHGRIADWGFYTAPESPKGTGRLLGKCALRHVFGTLGLHKVCGEAMAFNERSIRFHISLGFQQEGILREQYFDGQAYHNVICFGLLANEWQSNY